MDKYDVLLLDNQICFPLYACSKEIIRRYKPLLDEIGLTYTQYITMLALWEEKKLSVSGLGEKLYLDSGTLTPLLKTLENKGLIRRKRLENDERVLEVELTTKGEELKDRALGIPAKIAGQTNLTGKEAVELYRLLYKVLGVEEEE